MSLWKIAWRSIQQRSLASALTAVSMALGVSLVVAVLVVSGVVERCFHRGGEGYNLIVGGPKSSPLTLVLAGAYYIGQPAENVPYSYYKELHEGRLSGHAELAIPICLGDNYQGYRVVATTPEMFERLKRSRLAEALSAENLLVTGPHLFESLHRALELAKKAGVAENLVAGHFEI